MKYAILVQELPHGELFLYSNFRAAALDPCNPIDVMERRLYQLKKEEEAAQEKRGETVTGYPFITDMCRIDRVPIIGTKDVVFPQNIKDGYGNTWSAKCPECGGLMQVVRPGEARCKNECWTEEQS